MREQPGRITIIPPITWVPVFLMSIFLIPTILLMAGLAFLMGGHGIYWGFTHSLIVAAKQVGFHEYVQRGVELGDLALLGFLILAFWKGNWGMWMQLGFRCLTKQCRRFSPHNDTLPQPLLDLWPQISAWYQALWENRQGRTALSWGLFVLNWGVTLCVPIFMLAAFHQVWAKFLLTIGMILLSMASLNILWYWWQTRHFRRPDRRKSALAILDSAGISQETWSTIAVVCGPSPRPYVSLFSIFVVTPIAWIGFPLGMGIHIWMLLVLTVSSLALSLYIASIRYWLFLSQEKIPAQLCCNLPLLEFSQTISGHSSFWNTFAKRLTCS